MVSTILATNTPDNASYPDFLDWRTRNHVFQSMAAYRTNSVNLIGAGAPLHINSGTVSADLFNVLKVKPVLGRAFLPNEDRPGAANGTDAAIVSYGLWQRRFSSDPHAVGRTIDLDGKPYTIVGVMPAGFQFPIQSDQVDLWTTMAFDLTAIYGGKSMASQRGAHYLDVVARLKPNVTAGEAQAEMSMIVSALNKQYPENKARGVRVAPELNQLVGDVSTPLMILLVAVGCVLLIACANVANLLLARATTRQKEMAVRAALGAERSNVLGMVIRQGIVLAIWGVGIGLAGALLLTRIMSSLLYGVRPNDPVTFLVIPVFLIAVSIAASYIPARRATQVDPMVALRKE